MPTGKIEQVWDTKQDGSRLVGKNGEYRNVKIDGERYSVWDSKLFPKLVKGATISFTFAQKGDFKNLTAIEDAAGGNGQTTSAPPSQEGASPRPQRGNGGGGVSPTKDEEIIRQTSIKVMGDILTTQGPPCPQKPDEQAAWLANVTQLIADGALELTRFCLEPREAAAKDGVLARVKSLWARLKDLSAAGMIPELTPENAPAKTATVREMTEWCNTAEPNIGKMEADLRAKRAAETGDPWAE